MYLWSSVPCSVIFKNGAGQRDVCYKTGIIAVTSKNSTKCQVPTLHCQYEETEEQTHYNDVIMGAIASQITSLTIVSSTVYSDADQRKHQSSASLAFVQEIHRGPVNSPHRWPVTRKMFPFDDVIMIPSCHSTHAGKYGHKAVTICSDDTYFCNVTHVSIQD